MVYVLEGSCLGSKEIRGSDGSGHRVETATK